MAIKPAKTTGAAAGLHFTQDGGRLQCWKCMGSPQSKNRERREWRRMGGTEEEQVRERGVCFASCSMHREHHGCRKKIKAKVEPSRRSSKGKGLVIGPEQEQEPEPAELGGEKFAARPENVGTGQSELGTG